MPKPPTAQPAIPAHTGTVGNRVAISRLMPAATITSPVRISRRPRPVGRLALLTQGGGRPGQGRGGHGGAGHHCAWPLTEVMARHVGVGAEEGEGEQAWSAPPPAGLAWR